MGEPLEGDLEQASLTTKSRWGHHRQASLKRLATDKTLDAQSTTEAVPALAPSTHGLQLDPASEELPEHWRACAIWLPRSAVTVLTLSSRVRLKCPVS